VAGAPAARRYATPASRARCKAPTAICEQRVGGKSSESRGPEDGRQGAACWKPAPDGQRVAGLLLEQSGARRPV